MDDRQFDDEPSAADRWIADGPTWSSTPPSDASSSTPRIDARDPAADVQREIERLTDIARARAAAVAVAEAELVEAVAALRPFEGKYLATWRQWVAWQCGLTSSEAARVCRLAERLPGLPQMDAALRAGRLSAGVTDVLASDATPATEAKILAVAEVATGRQLEQLVRDHRQVKRHATGTTPADDQVDPSTAPSELTFGWGADGRHRGRWDLRPDEGATVEAALEAALAHLRPSEADIDAGSGAAAAIVDGELWPGEKPRSRRSDALVGLANTFLAGEANDGLLPESTQIILHRNLEPTGAPRSDDAPSPDRPADLSATPPACSEDEAEAASEPGRGRSCPTTTPREPQPTTLPGCGTLDPRIAALLECDALVITVEMIAGFPVSAPTATHKFNRAQRRAMRARDQHCRFPGCRRTRHLHAHHIKPFATSRRTSVADGVLLCPQHHALVHLRGYSITLGTDHRVTVTRPDGSVLVGAALPPPAHISRPAELPSDRRLTGTHEPLTTYARDVIVDGWLTADPPDPPEPPHPPDPPDPGPADSEPP
jgi:hypothetical protein